MNIDYLPEPEEVVHPLLGDVVELTALVLLFASFFWLVRNKKLDVYIVCVLLRTENDVCGTWNWDFIS